MTSADLMKFAISVLVIGSIHLIFRKREKRSINEIHIGKVAELGSQQGAKDVDFIFYFPTAQDAESASATLRGWEFNPVVRQSDGQHVLEFTQNMTLDPKIMDTLSLKFDDLARKNHGEFDGWGCEA